MENLDYHALRCFPYAILSTFLVLPVFFLVSFFVFSIGGGMPILKNPQTVDGLLFFGVILVWSAVVAKVICLYRLIDLTGWFRFAEISIMLVMMGNLLSQIVVWVKSATQSRGYFGEVRWFFTTLPDIFLIAGIAFIMNGLAELSRKVSDSWTGAELIKLRRFWIFLQVGRMICSSVAYFAFLNNEGTGFLRFGELPKRISVIGTGAMVLVLVCCICHEVLGIFIYLKARNVCQEYYLYIYNNGLSERAGKFL